MHTHCPLFFPKLFIIFIISTLLYIVWHNVFILCVISIILIFVFGLGRIAMNKRISLQPLLRHLDYKVKCGDRQKIVASRPRPTSKRIRVRPSPMCCERAAIY